MTHDSQLLSSSDPVGGEEMRRGRGGEERGGKGRRGEEREGEERKGKERGIGRMRIELKWDNMETRKEGRRGMGRASAGIEKGA